MINKKIFSLFKRKTKRKTTWYHWCCDEAAATGKSMRFTEFAENWWNWEKCPYVLGVRQIGHNITRGYCDKCATALKNHIPILLSRWSLLNALHIALKKVGITEKERHYREHMKQP